MKNNSNFIRTLVCCSACLALAFVFSFVKVIPLPLGGSATLCSMFFITIIGYLYGPKIGIGCAFIYGVMQFLQSPQMLSFFQVCCDYLIAFACLGLSGFFYKRKHGLIIGYIVGILMRAAFHSLGGYLYWMEYMPENFPVALAWAYPIIYNYSYILVEGIITVAVISLPPVNEAIKQIRRIARGEKN